MCIFVTIGFINGRRKIQGLTSIRRVSFTQKAFFRKFPIKSAVLLEKMSDLFKQLDQNKSKEQVLSHQLQKNGQAAQRNLAADNFIVAERSDSYLFELFFEKECNVFCPGTVSNKCQCGLLDNQHEKKVLERCHGSHWDSVTCTRKTKWRCSGTVKFKNQNRFYRGSPYMRIADDADADKLVTYIHDKWEVPEPSLIISVTGGASLAKMKKEVWYTSFYQFC